MSHTIIACIGITAALGSLGAQLAYLRAIDAGQRGTAYIALAALLCSIAVAASLTVSMP